MQLGLIYAALSVAFAGAYGVAFLRASPSATRTMVKALGIGLLALVTLVEDGPLLLVAALLACAVGDACLAQKGETWLKRGIAAFFVGHLIYILLFLVAGGGIGPSFPIIAGQLAVLVAAGAMAAWLLPSLGDMRIPVLAYVGVIVTMTLLAIGLPSVLWLAALGAVVFLASDALLSAELFKWREDAPERAWSDYAVWVLYYLGQAMIVLAFLDRPESVAPGG